MNQGLSISAELGSRWRRGVARVGLFFMTIRGRILIAFLVMSTITAALGYYATLRHQGRRHPRRQDVR